MAIPISEYVNIQSYATGGALVAQKMTIGRVLTTNTLAPMGSVLEFTSAANVMAYFGSQSKEYAFADKYFKWVSKLFTKAKLISFARYTPQGTAVSASMISGVSNFNLTTIKGITDGSFTLEYVDPDTGLKTASVTGIDFSAAPTLGEVAEVLQTKLQAVSGFEAVIVEFNGNLNGGRFVLTNSGEYGKFKSATGTVAVALGFNAASAPIVSEGNAGTNTIAEEVDRIMDISDNCYTFTFLDAQTEDTYVQVASWNHDRNADFIFMVQPNSLDEALDLQLALKAYDFCWIQLDSVEEMQIYEAMAALANVDYTQDHAAISFMYQPFPNDTPVVESLALKRRLDALNINYLGLTGKNIDPFLQRGMCQGSIPDATICANAIWLKDQIIYQVMSLFMRANAIYANASDSAKIAAVCNQIWEQGLRNGCILAGKTLTNDEKATIENLTGDNLAWNTIVNQGYIFTYEISTNATDGTKYFSFRLIYGACDTIRKVEGTNIAITTTA